MVKRVVVACAGQGGCGEAFGHTCWWFPHSLSPEGVASAKGFVERNREHLRNCGGFFTSPVVLAQQTLIAMMANLGKKAQDFDRAQICEGLFTGNPAMYQPGPAGAMKHWVARNREFAASEAFHLYRFVQAQVLTSLPSHMDSALCISHRGLIDLLFARAREVLGDEIDVALRSINEFNEGEGFVFYFNNDLLYHAEELRIAAPATAQA